MSTYQYWQDKFEHPDVEEMELKAVIKGLFDYYETEYGVRRLSSQIRDYYQLIGKEAPNHKRIQRLMYEMGLKCTKYNRGFASTIPLRDQPVRKRRISSIVVL